ncbi:MAG: shikimate dehydrogenase, partial [Gammaproteobacteria bacterium]|nr:shikimate dehydrogenase [Gammaproteobacteria bacterium]
GAARGILSPLLQLEPDAITVANRTPSKARDLVTNFKYASNLLACDLDALSSMDSFDLVINATSSGLSGELPSLPDSIFGPDSCSYDMVYGESEPVFVTW